MKQAAGLSSTVYLIVGMHRSGTSSVGRLMEAVGFDFGDNLLEGIDSINDRGFWEDRDVVALDEHIFSLFGSQWYNFGRLPGKWWEEDKIKDLVGVAETWYQEGFAQDKPIAVKDPRFCRLLPFWKRVFLGMGIQPHIIFVVRHPAEVAASLRRRDGFSLQVGYLLWLSYVIDGLYYSRNLDLALIDYETLLQHPDRVVKRLVRDDISSLHGLSEQQMTELVRKTLDAQSRHQRSAEVMSHDEVQGDVQVLAHELYHELVKASAEQAKALADKYRKRFYRLLDHHRDVLVALQATVNQQVVVNQKLTEIGNSHSHALSVIQERDRQLEEIRQQVAQGGKSAADIESAVAQMTRDHEQQQAALKEYIAKCEQRIAGQDTGLAENRGYIARCETRIKEQDVTLAEQVIELNALRERLVQQQNQFAAHANETETRTRDHEQALAALKEYIAKCEHRIAEQDIGLAENRGYIARCEARIREQDNGLQIRDQILGERLERIQKQEARLGEHVGIVESLTRDHEQKQAALKEYIAKCEHRIAEQDLGLAENRGYIARCETHIREQDAALADQIITLNALREKLAQQESQIAAHTVATEALVRDHEQKQTALREYIAKCEHRIAEQDLGLAGNRGYIARCETHIREQDAALADQVRELGKMRSALSAAQDDNALKQREIEDSLGRSTRLEKEHQSQVGTLQRQVEEMQETIVTLRQQVADGNALNQRLQAELGTARSIIEMRDRKIEAIAMAMTSNESNLRERQQVIETLEQHVSSLRQQLGEAVDTISERERTLSTTGEKLQQIETLGKQRIAWREQQLDEITVRLAVLQGELAATLGRLAMSQRELDRYRSYRIVRLLDRLGNTKLSSGNT